MPTTRLINRCHYSTTRLTRLRTVQAFIVAIPLVLTASASSNAAEEISVQRWAIITSEKFQTAGVADLVTAALSEHDGIELVERDDDELLEEELELATLTKATSVTERLRLGERVSADVLLLLDVEDGDEEPLVKIVVSDCRTGARLRLAFSLFTTERPDQMVPVVVEVVDDVRRRFAQGVRYVVGVSPLSALNLTHRFDHFQLGLARLIESSFAELPAVAVIESEEAQLISRELALRDDPRLNRIVPLLIDGEFSVAASPEGAISAITITLGVQSSGEQRQSVESGQLEPDALADWARHLPRQLIHERDDGENNVGIVPEQQVSWLSERAGMFALVGDWELAVGLRHAALLVDPRNAGERLRLIEDERMLIATSSPPRAVQRRAPPSEAHIEWQRRLATIYLDQLANQEYLVRNALITQRQAFRLIETRTFGLRSNRLGDSGAAAERMRKQTLEVMARHV